MSNIGYKLRERRQELKMTMLDVAYKCGVSEATVSRWESGEIRNMKIDKIKLLADALQISPSVILDTEGYKYELTEAEKEVIDMLRSVSAKKASLLKSMIAMMLDKENGM